MKNIPTHSKSSYLCQLIAKVEKVLKRMRWKELSLTETKQLKHKCQQQCPTSTNKHLQFKNKKVPSTYSGYDKIFMK